MVEHATLLSCAKFRLQGSFLKPSHFIPSKVGLTVVQRGSKRQRYKNAKIWREICDFSADTAIVLGRSVRQKESSMRYFCFGTLINLDNTATVDLVPVFDQLLMMISIALTYIAGVVPHDKAYHDSGKMPDLDAVPPRSSSGSAIKSDHQVNVENAWAEVKRKLLYALDAVQQDESMEDRVSECENYVAKCPSSLSAVAEGPRLRLLWETLQRLEKEVKNISGSSQIVDRSDWMAIWAEIAQTSGQLVFVTWLEEELHLENKKHDKDIFLMMIKRLNRDDNILKNIRKSGKEDLYADVLFFLRFHALGMNSCYDSKLFAHHGVDILEDLVITLADGITTNYLELISVDSNISNEMNCLGLKLCSLSTRALQKLRNEAALKQWLHQNMDSVVSMYEDRFDLYNFQIQLIKRSDTNEQGKHQWWKKLTLKKAASTSSVTRYMVIGPLPLSVKRTKELRALSGWRYYFSLFLEFSDITMPLVRVIFAKVCSAISFLLVSLVGRSLGLIYSGIRQSLGWRGKS